MSEVSAGPHEAPAARRPELRLEVGSVFTLILAGGGIVLLASGGVWLRLAAPRPAPFSPLDARIHGRTLFGALPGLAVVLVLGAVLMLVAGRLTRTVLAALLVVVSLAAGWFAVRGLTAPAPGRAVELLGGVAKTGGASVDVSLQRFWPVLGVGGAVVGLVGSGALLVRCRRWPAGLSRRYEAPAAAAKSDDPWRSLDRGDDPTIGDR